MAQPARKLDKPAAAPRLRLVPAPAATRTSSRRTARGEAECRAVFTLVTLVFVALTVFGLARVALTAEVARAAFDAGELRQDIRNEQQMAERLEADRSALLTPSRIEEIAASSMQMTQPKSVRYLRLPSDRPKAPPTTAADTRAATNVAAVSSGPGHRLGALLSTAMDLATDEAMALLIGDVGLASSR